MLTKLDRLTYRDPKTQNTDLKYHDASIPCRKAPMCPEKGTKCTGFPCELSEIIERLAAYEDTRMYPEEIQKMKEREKRRRMKSKKTPSSV